MDESIKIMELLIDENEISSGVYATSLVNSPAIEVDFVAFNKSEPIKLEFAIESEDKMILTGPLMIPDQLIYRYSPEEGEHYVYSSAETIEKVAVKFAKNSNINNITHEHSKILDNNVVFESWIITDSEHDKSNALGYSLPVGTWMVSVKIEDKTYWDKYIKSGKIKGFSLEGFFIKQKTKQKPKNTKKNKNNFQKMSVLKKMLAFFSKEDINLFEYYLVDGTILAVGEDMTAPIYDAEGNEVGLLTVTLNEMPEDTVEDVVEETTTEVVEETEIKQSAETQVEALNETINTILSQIQALTTEITEIKSVTFASAEKPEVKDEKFNIKKSTGDIKLNDILKYRKKQN